MVVSGPVMADSPLLYHTDSWLDNQWGSTDPSVLLPDGQSYQGITTQHWKDQTGLKHCMNRTCRAKFSLFSRCHHCRRCGDVFCAECLKYQRRLNLMAHPDPNGRPYKVCKACFDKGPQTLGVTRSFMTLFEFYKGQGQGQQQNQTELRVNKNGVNVSNFREKLDVVKECDRIKHGFEASVTHSSGIKRLIKDIIPSVGPTPEWKKSPYHLYGKIAQTCYVCGERFNLLRPKHLCVVCGVAVCRKGNSGCSTNDMLVYIPDGCDKSHPLQPEVAIVHIVGCPPKEPSISEALDICHACRQTLEDHQVSAYHQQRASLETSFTVDDTEEFWDALTKHETKLREIQEKVERQLCKYQELIEALEVSPVKDRNTAQQKPDNKSNIQTLAKAQNDIGDHLTIIAMTVQSLKKLCPQTPPQTVLLKNFTKSKCDFYLENMSIYRDLHRKLEIVTPSEVLSVIQTTVDRNAINSCYIVLKQLALESLHLVTKHQLDSDLPVQLAAVEDVVQGELQMSLQAVGEPWEEHRQIVQELLQQQVTDKKHRIISVSRRRSQKYGPSYVKSVLLDRTEHTLRRIHLELTTKCSDRSFSKTKAKVRAMGQTINKDNHD